MASPACPEKRRFRPFFIILLSAYMVGCLIAATVAILVTKQAVAAVPFVWLASRVSLPLLWAMLWVTNPGERECALAVMDRTLLAAAARRLRGESPTAAAKKRGRKPRAESKGDAAKKLTPAEEATTAEEEAKGEG